MDPLESSLKRLSRRKPRKYKRGRLVNKVRFISDDEVVDDNPVLRRLRGPEPRRMEYTPIRINPAPSPS